MEGAACLVHEWRALGGWQPVDRGDKVRGGFLSPHEVIARAASTIPERPVARLEHDGLPAHRRERTERSEAPPEVGVLAGPDALIEVAGLRQSLAPDRDAHREPCPEAVCGQVLP